MKNILTNYLKIFRKLILTFVLVFLLGCVSGTNNLALEEPFPEPSAEISVAEKFDEPAISKSSPEEITHVEDTASRDSAKVGSVKWISSETEKISPVLLLPKVNIREKVVSSSIPPDYSAFHNIDLRISDRNLSPAQQIITETDSRIETVPSHGIVKSLNNGPVQSVPFSLINDEIEEYKESPIISEQEMRVLVSDKIKITLPGNGWIYLSGNENSSLNYSGREFTDNNTVYTFIPEDTGDFVLNFEYQDLIKNICTKEKVYLTVNSQPAESGFQAAAMDTGLDKPETSDPPNLKALLKEYLSTQNVEGIFNMAPDLVRSTDPEVHSLLPETAELLYSSSRSVPTALILEVLIMDKNYKASKDRFLYLLGKTYEADSPVRNELTAADYYKQLLDTYPASIYWDESQDRYRFLKRRYIDIR